MGIEVAIAAISLAVGVAGTVQAQQQQKAAARDQKRIRREQQGTQAAQAAQEQRQRIREERVRRAQILQASELTGVAGSAGEAGAVSGISSQFGAGTGFNTGQQRSAQRITALSQSAADKQSLAAQWGQISGVGMSIFQASGGFSTLASPFQGTKEPKV